jgi:hypothetical protein
MCNNPKSQLAKQAYALCLSNNQMQRFAAEACVAHDQPAVKMSSGQLLSVAAIPYDIVSLQPAMLVIEVMGSQHSGNDMQHTNSHESRGQSSSEVDKIKAKAAMDAGYTVLWLMAGKDLSRNRRWQRALNNALQHVKAGGPAKHFISL